jgi:dTDP-D-glucose 4,6-dehydratase
MRYFLDPHPSFLCVVQEGCDEFYVGYVYPREGDDGRYSVRNGSNNEFAVVQSLEEAITAIAVFYKENPPWWDRKRARRRAQAITGSRL